MCFMGDKRILDEETRRQLQGYTPFSAEATMNFTPAEFENIKDETIRPVFSLSPFTQEQKDQLVLNSKEYEPGVTAPEKIGVIADKNKKVLFDSVKGWKNLFDSGNGEEIPYGEDGFNRLAGFIVSAIRQEVERISCLTEPTKLSLK